jgi:hypothetical protein
LHGGLPPVVPPELDELDEPDEDELDDEEELDEEDEDDPPLEVEVEPPEVEVEPPEVEVDPPEVELPPVEVEPPVLVEVMTMLPPDELPPPKNPPKNPPPKPPPLLPPITVTPPLPPAVIGGGGMYGAGIGTYVSSCSQHAGLVTRRRMRFTWRGAGAAARRATCRRAFGFATLACFTYWGREVAGASAT